MQKLVYSNVFFPYQNFQCPNICHLPIILSRIFLLRIVAAQSTTPTAVFQYWKKSPTPTNHSILALPQQSFHASSSSVSWYEGLRRQLSNHDPFDHNTYPKMLGELLVKSKKSLNSRNHNNSVRPLLPTAFFNINEGRCYIISSAWCSSSPPLLHFLSFFTFTANTLFISPYFIVSFKSRHFPSCTL